MNWAIGPEIEKFEKKLANYVGSKFCVTFNSGTSALHASLLSIGLKSNEEVLVPSFTFVATANSVLMAGGIPHFVDIEKEKFGLDPALTEESIDKKVKAIMPIHYAGLPCKIEELRKIADRKKVFLIEDAAESLGSILNKKKVGSFGDLSVLSFAPNKIITTGEGGAVLTNSEKFYEKLKLLRSHGRLENSNYFSSSQKPEYVQLGYNWRMATMVAALGISQLSRIEKLIAMRRNNAKFISTKIKKFSEITIPPEPKNNKHVFQLYSILLPDSKIRNDLMQFLGKRGIMTKVYFEPVHRTPFYKKITLDKFKLDNTEEISDRILSLPIYPDLQQKDLQYITSSISDFFKN
ncbi:MAG: DegT/DnrJ/EryC1/StrS family aminotransferase [Nitrosopumilus sp.]|nr:DegT/DnrJ/EryC1/StrS family aminotransferase [Nitrosopumilus sp.]